MLGDRIAALRTRFGWSQAELARRLHISSSAVGMYEQGRREPPVDILAKLANVLGVSMDYLILGRPVYHRDWIAQSAIDSRQEYPGELLDGLSRFSRDELIVLLAAAIIGKEE